MKLIIDVEKDYYEQIKYNVEHGQEYKPFKIIANGTPYEPKEDLISREALKKHAIEVYQGNGVELEPIMMVPLCAIDNAPTVAYPFEKFRTMLCGTCQANMRIEPERPQGEWIPVSERLPNCNGVYNVTRKLNEGETIYFISDASYFDGQNTWHADTGINHGRPYLTDIIAWQPLPEPYRKGGAK